MVSKLARTLPAAVCGGLALAAGLTACVNTRVFTETELAEVGRGCGLAAGEVMQEPDHPRFLFLYALEPTRAPIADWRRSRTR
jgi:hypothetical protein